MASPTISHAQPSTQITPSEQTPQILIPTWGASPGGVYHYTAAAGWALKNSGLPSGMFWFWIAADPFDPNHWLVLGNSTSAGYGSEFFLSANNKLVTANGATDPLWMTTNAGQSWTAIPLPAAGALTSRIAMRRVEWSETVPGQWMLAWGIDSVGSNGYEVLVRGDTTSVSNTLLFGPGPGTGAIEAFPGEAGDIVVHDRRGNGYDTARFGYVAPNQNSVSGVREAPWLTFWEYMERMPNTRALVGFATGITSGLWGTLDYRTAAPSSRSGVTGTFTAPVTDSSIYITGGSGLQQVKTLFGSPLVTTVSGGANYNGFIRADRKNHTTVAALASNRTSLYVLTHGCSTWEMLDIPYAVRTTGLANRLEVISGNIPIDTDCDALPDDWELNGYTYTDPTNGTTVVVNLPAMGANPLHKDIFVQADWMAPGSSCSAGGLCVKYRPQPYPDALQAVAQAYKNAPIPNPDGIDGIHLHIDAGRNSIMNVNTGATWGALSRANEVPYQEIVRAVCVAPNNAYPDSVLIRKQFFPRERARIFYYALFASKYDGHEQSICILPEDSRSSGVSLPGEGVQMILITLGISGGKYNTSIIQAGTFMHELGHVLGLDHGGPARLAELGQAAPEELGDVHGYKPNYFSVMNYAYQFGTLYKAPGSKLIPVIDYAHSNLLNLNEAALDERIGIASQSAYFLPNTGAMMSRSIRQCILIGIVMAILQTIQCRLILTKVLSIHQFKY